MDQRTVRINDRIRAKEVRVIDDDGAQLGIMTPQQALTIAEEKGLDLVEIVATANPPVRRIMNSGKYFYQQAKREPEGRKHQRHVQVKEVKFRPKIDEHDFQFKKRNVERFLNDGNCGIGLLGRQRPSLGDYVTGSEARDRATAAGSR